MSQQELLDIMSNLNLKHSDRFHKLGDTGKPATTDNGSTQDTPNCRTPINEDDIQLRRSIRNLQVDELGVLQLCKDGVMRSSDAERITIDAFGLSPQQIKLWFERVPVELRKAYAEDNFKDEKGNFVVDGTKLSREQLMRSDMGCLPPPRSKELQEKALGMLAERKEKERQAENEDRKEGK